MALRIDSSQNRNLYVGTGTEVAVSDGNAIVTGTVGIGTTNPSNKLSLAGSGQNWATSPAIKMWDSYNSKGWYVGSANNAATGDFYIRSVTAEGAYPVSTDQQFAIKQSGNVGIGTITPSEKLHVTAYAKADTGFKAGNYTILNESGNETSLSNIAYYPMFFKTNNSTRMTISNAGNVGIGTTSPNYKLDVVGNAYISTTLQVHGNINFYDDLIGTSYKQGTTAVKNKRLKNIILESSTETNQSVIHPYFNNGLGNFIAKGGTITFGNVTTPPSLAAQNSMFKPDQNFMSLAASNITASTWSMTLTSTNSGQMNFSYGCWIGITFGSASFDPDSCKIEVNTNADGSGTWITALNSTVADTGYFTFYGSGGTGIKSIRFTMGQTSQGPRVCNIYAYNYAAAGMNEFFLSKAGGSVFGDIIPGTDYLSGGTYLPKLGGTGNRWNEAYIDKLADINNSFGTSGQVLSSNASGQLDWISGSSLPGGPYLPLSAGSSYPLTGDLYQTMGAIGVAQTDQDYLAKIYESNADGFMSLYTGQPTPLERIRISSYGDSFFVPANNGNVGIGVTDPEKKLEVKSDTTYDGIMLDVLSNPEITFRDRGNSDTLVGTGRHALDGFHIDTYSGNAFFIKGSNRYVGIGTTSPVEKLQVEGKVYIQGNGQDWNETTPGPTRGSVHFDPGTTTADTGNALTFGASDTPGSPNEGSTAHAGIYTRSDGAYGSKMYFATTDSYAVGSKTRMMIDYNGNVGIGTTSPGYKLEVAGTARITSALTFGGNVNNIIAGTGSSLDFKSNGEYYFRKGANTNLTILSGGNVGIGETSPSEKLHMNNTTGTGCFIRFQNTGGSGVYIGGRSESMEMYTNGTIKMDIGSNGSVQFNAYNSTNQTGTPTYMLGTDASGNVVKTNTSNTPVGSNIYTMPNITGTATWVLLGRFTASNGGQSVFIKMVTNSGYNASIDQNAEVYIRFKTSNGGSVDANGFSGDSSFYTIGAYSGYPGGNIKWVSNAAGTAATSYELYINMPSYSGNGGFYSVENTVGTWTPLNNAATDPGAASSTILLPTKQFKVGGSDLVVGAGGANSYFANSNVGIGTTTPQRVLDVNVGGNSGVGASFAGTISAGEYQGIHFGYCEAGNGNYRHSALVFERDDAGIGDATGKIHILNSPSGAGSANLSDSRLTIIPSGNVGIGTDSPDKTLTVGGTNTTHGIDIKTKIGTTVYKLWEAEQFFANEGYQGMYLDNVKKIQFRADGDSYFVGGDVGIGTTSPTKELDVRDEARIWNGANGIELSYSTTNTSGIVASANTSGNLEFRTNVGAAARMFITNAGNVGIGTTSPDGNLEVVGTTVISTVTDGVNAVLIGLAGSNRTTIQFDTADTTHTNRQWGLTNIAGDFYIGRHGLNVMKMNNNGNVGIGTTGPDSKLHVKGISTFEETTAGAGTQLKLVGQDSSGQFNFLVGKQYNVNNAFEITPSTVANGGVFTNPAFIVNSAGNVGIGVTNPGNKLRVEGSVRINDSGNGQIFFGTGGLNKIELDGTDMKLSSGGLAPTITMSNQGLIKFGLYGLSGQGTPANLLGVDGSGNVVKTNSFNLILDDTPAASTTSGSGNIVNWSVSETVTAGTLYAVKTNGGWTAADADSEQKSTYMLAIALGSNATAGMLLQGFFYKSSHGFIIGAPLYVSNTLGSFSNSRPTGTGDYVRIIGYATSANYIYFDPDKTWVKIA